MNDLRALWKRAEGLAESLAAIVAPQGEQPGMLDGSRPGPSVEEGWTPPVESAWQPPPPLQQQQQQHAYQQQPHLTSPPMPQPPQQLVFASGPASGASAAAYAFAPEQQQPYFGGGQSAAPAPQQQLFAPHQQQPQPQHLFSQAPRAPVQGHAQFCPPHVDPPQHLQQPQHQPQQMEQRNLAAPPLALPLAFSRPSATPMSPAPAWVPVAASSPQHAPQLNFSAPPLATAPHAQPQPPYQQQQLGGPLRSSISSPVPAAAPGAGGAPFSAPPIPFFSPIAAAPAAGQGNNYLTRRGGGGPTGGGGFGAAAPQPPRYTPVEDGFITTAGHAERGARYGNNTGATRFVAGVGVVDVATGLGAATADAVAGSGGVIGHIPAAQPHATQHTQPPLLPPQPAWAGRA